MRHMKRNSLYKSCENNKDFGRNAINKNINIAEILDFVSRNTK